ncbi:MAG: DUF59 domain-containing protein [Bacteroidetes bacterium]|nr:DUF59 domain-containing protein [Bacteroidota bacterium]MBU1678364.1 DUF59 domain-containing protein [Bacteroidota bacterium]MBU2505679.1 DUF59 domain-containing protein [Bacteroidota bacterium]
MHDKSFIELEIIRVLKTVFDPEIPVDIYELGLIYETKLDEDFNLYVKMTLTSPACPVAGSLPGDVKKKLKNIKQIKDVIVDLVWDPPWDKDRMSEEARLELGFY